jgi:hypothetical protein
VKAIIEHYEWIERMVHAYVPMFAMDETEQDEHLGAILTALKAGQALAAHMRWWLCDEHKTEKVAMGDHCLNQDCQYARTALGSNQ